MRHWTEESPEAFAHKLAFDFIAQIESKIESLGLSQQDLAGRLGVSEGAVSKLLNNPQNLTLRTIAKYSRALGIKAAIVAYDDDDPTNEKGLISSQIFTTCWEYAGKPRDVWALENLQLHQTSTEQVVLLQIPHHGTLPFMGYCGVIPTRTTADYGDVMIANITNTGRLVGAGAIWRYEGEQQTALVGGYSFRQLRPESSENTHA